MRRPPVRKKIRRQTQESPIGAQITGVAPQRAVTSQPLAATAERTIVVESPLYHVELSNRGAVVRSWQLNRYKDDSNPPRTLDVVHTEASQQFGWPLSACDRRLRPTG